MTIKEVKNLIKNLKLSNDLKLFNEGLVGFYASKHNLRTKNSVFYNPMMRVNRDITLLLLKVLIKHKLIKNKIRFLDLMAASGVRSLRIIKEIGLDSIEEIIINDISKKCYDTIIKNLTYNNIHKNIKSKKVIVKNENALELLLKNKVFDFIQVDPFEDINKFLQLSISRVRDGGVLGLTTTDTASLSGTYPKTCLRRYDAIPQRIDFKHEFGLRILIRNTQLIGAKQDKALIPLFSYYYKHHFGVFFRVKSGRRLANKVFKEHEYLLICNHCFNRKTTDNIFNNKECDLCNKEFLAAGKFYTGKLWDRDLVLKMNNLLKSEGLSGRLRISGETKKLLNCVIEESSINMPYTINTHLVGKYLGMEPVPIGLIKKSLEEQGFTAVKTHFNPVSIRTNADYKVVLKTIKAIKTTRTSKTIKNQNTFKANQNTHS